MSMMLMVKAMQAKVGNPLRKLVLIKLADNANDMGECWPSHQHVADQCEISKTSVRNHIKELEKMGLLIVEHRDGPKGNSSNLYHLTLQGVSGGDIGVPADGMAGIAGDGTRTSNYLEPVIEPLKKSVSQKLDFSSWPGMPSEQLMSEWKQLRKRLKAGVTQTVINRTGKELHIAVKAGFTVDQCFEQWVYKGWRGFEASWMMSQKPDSQPQQQNKQPRAFGS